MTEENKNLVGDIVSIEKQGEEVLITKETIKDDLNYANPDSPDPSKPEYVVCGSEERLNIYRFPNKEKALEFYGVQIKNCQNGLDVIKEGMAEFEKDIMDADIFEKISSIKEKLDTNKYKGKYKALDTYLEKHAQYKQGLAQIKIRGEHIPYFETIIKTIEEL